MKTPQLGYLCLSENPSAEAGRALIRQFVLVREADRMGYDDIWLGEHHADGVWPHGGTLALLGHLSAVTSKARIGALCLLPALRNPVLLAEELATLDQLSKGRFELGVASGAAFPALLQAHGLTAETARSALCDGLAALAAPAAAPALAPFTAPLQAGLRKLWVAADDPVTLATAAPLGAGIVAAATHTRERVRRACEAWRAASGTTPPVTLARFACSAETREAALAIARPYFETLAARATANGWGANRELSVARDVEALVAESLIGSHAEVARQFNALAETHGASRVAIVPTSGQFDTHKHILAAFVDEVRPLLED